MIKTVILSGEEQRVDGLGGQNTVIVNFGSAALFVSSKPDIIPDGDDVVTISPGNAANLYDTNGTVHLLGTGKVQLEGTNYNTVPITGSGSAGGGGVIPTADTMPHMDGIVGYYTPENMDIVNNLWRNRFGTGENIELINAEKNGSALRFLPNGYGTVKYQGIPNVIYIVSQSSDIPVSEKQIALVGKNLKNMVNGNGFSVMINPTFPNTYTLTSIGFDADSEISADSTYHCVCAARDSLTSTGSIYVDAEVTGNISQAKDSTSYSSGSLCINNWRNTNSTLWNSTASAVTDCLFFAFGVLSHTDEQIKQNSEWLMKKYLGGG